MAESNEVACTNLVCGSYGQPNEEREFSVLLKGAIISGRGKPKDGFDFWSVWLGGGPLHVVCACCERAQVIQWGGIESTQ